MNGRARRERRDGKGAGAAARRLFSGSTFEDATGTARSAVKSSRAPNIYKLFKVIVLFSSVKFKAVTRHVIMSSDPAPLSKTAKYKKITKPLLERKRRARINRCLDELKDLMVGALEIDDDNLSKLEKADILELTVNHLTKLHSPKDPVLEAKKFQAGFGQCAAEACRFIMSVPDLDANVSQNLIGHLSRLISAQPLTIQVPERPTFSPPTSPSSMVSDRHHYYSDQERSSSDAEDSLYSGDGSKWYNRSTRMPPKASPPASGLLTTVDKLAPHHALSEQMNGHVHGQRNTYFNRVPAEAKDIILQKIRQHIMDKRGNENCADNGGAEPPEPKYLHRDEPYKTEFAYQYPVHVPGNDTLDLRKVRSPTKVNSEAKKLASYPVVNQLDATPIVESKVEVARPPSVPEQCELAMDYSNLPPKKKRKLIEYQEYKKQEAARLKLEAFYAEKKERHGDGPPVDEEGNRWRPW